MTDTKIIVDEVTRGTVDGSRKAIGRLKLVINLNCSLTGIYIERIR
jgi:hypothetical protein